HNEKLANELKDTTYSNSWYKTTSKLLKSNDDTHIIPYLETQNNLTETETEIAQVLNTYFANQSSVDDTNAALPALEQPPYPLLSDIHISVDDVKDAICLLKPNKAPGPDLITPKLLKEGVNQLLAPLSYLFNLSLSLRQYPDSWKDANVTAIHKKDSRSQPSNYRPISLLCYLGKLMERCMHKHIFNYFKHNRIISPYQSGFQSGDSTINQLVYLYNKFLQALDEGKEIRVVFCDVSKAFDKVWHKGLLFKLKSIGFSNQLLEWFSSYLSNRRQRVCYKGCTSSWENISAGVPQGSKYFRSNLICNLYK
ncbi:MAG: reverse transcriptase family protein, partial [Candidatus Thiodiazotropha sp.]